MLRRLFVPFLCLSACTPAPYTSYVGPIDTALAPQVATDMAAFVRRRIRPTDGPIQIEQPASDQAIGPNLVMDLQDSGFTVVNSNAKHLVRYAASPLNDDILTRISVDRADAARLYRNKPGAGLAPLGPFTVTEMGE